MGPSIESRLFDPDISPMGAVALLERERGHLRLLEVWAVNAREYELADTLGPPIGALERLILRRLAEMDRKPSGESGE